MARSGLKPIHSSKLVGRMVNGVPKGTQSYIAAKTRELKEEEINKKLDIELAKILEFRFLKKGEKQVE
jgi:hypothetical protein